MRYVQRTKELDRVLSLPQRDALENVEELIEIFTSHFKTDRGTQKLLPIQAAALFDIYNCFGLFGPVAVGEGKTLISLLAPAVLESRRPLIILPAKHIRHKIEDTEEKLRWHWRLPKNRRFISYEALGRVAQKKFLDEYQPDLIVCDEAHKLKNTKAAVTRRVFRYLRNNFSVKFVALSGTFMRHKVLDFAHILYMTSRHCGYFPLPHSYDELKDWSDALQPDNKGEPIEPGALLSLPGSEFGDARPGFRERLLSTPGVVATRGSNKQDLPSLSVSTVYLPDDDPLLDEKLEQVRDTWETLEGYAISSALEMHQLIRQMSLGFYYRYIERPPDEWFDARKAWAQFVRGAIPGSDLDSELAVAQAFPHCSELLNWREWKSKIKPKTEAVWLSTKVLELAASYAKNPKTLVWVDYTETGRALSSLTGVPFFSKQATDEKGRSILHYKGPAIVSSHSVGEGFDLQYDWADQFVVSVPSSALCLEQMLGRTHRWGQQEDSINVDVLINCTEHYFSLLAAIEDSHNEELTLGAEFRLCYCDKLITPPKTGAGRWR